MTVSIKDIARAAHVSHSTVSRALGDSPLVSTETKARIQRLAAQMGYSPDARARSLVMGRTQTIGVVVTTIADPFIAEVVQAIEWAAYTHGYSVILASSCSEPGRELAAVEMLQSKRVDGVIVTSSRVGALYQKHLDQLGVPVVLVNSHSAEMGSYTYSIGVNNRHGGKLATQHLLELGHRRVAYVTGAADHSDDRERFDGYRESLLALGINIEEGWVVPGDGRARHGKRTLDALLSLTQSPTAVFCYNDMTAVGILSAARTRGILVPGDLAVVGFDDIPLASYLAPTLTTVAQPMSKLGRRAIEMVLDLVDEDQDDDRSQVVSHVIVQGRLVVRESSGGLMAAEAGAIHKD